MVLSFYQFCHTDQSLSPMLLNFVYVYVPCVTDRLNKQYFFLIIIFVNDTMTNIFVLSTTRMTVHCVTYH